MALKYQKVNDLAFKTKGTLGTIKFNIKKRFFHIKNIKAKSNNLKILLKRFLLKMSFNIKNSFDIKVFKQNKIKFIKIINSKNILTK